jgi:hypothetical protein
VHFSGKRECIRACVRKTLVRRTLVNSSSLLDRGAPLRGLPHRGPLLAWRFPRPSIIAPSHHADCPFLTLFVPCRRDHPPGRDGPSGQRPPYAMFFSLAPLFITAHNSPGDCGLHLKHSLLQFTTPCSRASLSLFFSFFFF